MPRREDGERQRRGGEKVFIGEAKSAIELVTKAWSWLLDRRDPVRLQCVRLIEAFEAHGIARQQIGRVLPAELALPMASFSSPGSLKDRLTPQLLDWAARYLNLDRPWLDNKSEHPHMHVDGYKNESIYMTWMQERIRADPDVNRRIHVLASQDLSKVRGEGYLTLLYVEDCPGLDDQEMSRYWRLSSEWPADHPPCIASMLKVIDIARANGVLVIGRVIPHEYLSRFELGRMFAPQMVERGGPIWYPEDCRVVQ